MMTIPKGVAVISCGFLLLLGLSNDVAQADYASSPPVETKTDQPDHSQGGQTSHELDGNLTQGGRMIKGEVLRVEGDNCIVKGEDGKEVRLHIDQTTKMSERELNQGSLVEAKVNDQNHALWILSSDRRSDHTLESGQTSTER
jgi:hypothetical protein